jgi:hypothetical protein
MYLGFQLYTIKGSEFFTAIFSYAGFFRSIRRKNPVRSWQGYPQSQLAKI